MLVRDFLDKSCTVHKRQLSEFDSWNHLLHVHYPVGIRTIINIYPSVLHLSLVNILSVNCLSGSRDKVMENTFWHANKISSSNLVLFCQGALQIQVNLFFSFFILCWINFPSFFFDLLRKYWDLIWPAQDGRLNNK